MATFLKQKCVTLANFLLIHTPTLYFHHNLWNGITNNLNMFYSGEWKNYVFFWKRIALSNDYYDLKLLFIDFIGYQLNLQT